jgi:hypothetical protein
MAGPIAFLLVQLAVPWSSRPMRKDRPCYGREYLDQEHETVSSVKFFTLQEDDLNFHFRKILLLM